MAIQHLTSDLRHRGEDQTWNKRVRTQKASQDAREACSSSGECCSCCTLERQNSHHAIMLDRLSAHVGTATVRRYWESVRRRSAGPGRKHRKHRRLARQAGGCHARGWSGDSRRRGVVRDCHVLSLTSWPGSLTAWQHHSLTASQPPRRPAAASPNDQHPPPPTRKP